MSAQYREGRREALTALGLAPTQQDNPVLERFVQGLTDDGPDAAKPRGGNRPFHRQSWGKPVEYSTSNQDFRGGGTRL